MGERLRALDWSRTAAGPVAIWSHSLETAVRIMLTSRFAMWMGWGPELTFFCNDAFLSTLGATQARALGAPAREAWAERWPLIGPRAETVVRTGGAAWDEALPLFLTRSGQIEQTYHTFSYSPVPDDDGGVGGVLCVVADVTERTLGERRLAEPSAAREREARADAQLQIEALQREVEAAKRAKDEFLAMLGHELRNPLAPITIALYLMRLRYKGVAEKERAVIERQVDHLVRLVDDLLDVSRITRGKVGLKRERVELSEIVARAVETASPLLEQQRHHLAVDVPPRGLTVDADVGRLVQVVSNLLTNAAKYTGSGGRIAVEGGRRGDEIVLSVRDDGIGIDIEMLPRIFELFAQERQALDRSQGGLGLGLAIVRSLVVMHGGSVSASSEGRGRGSEFTVRLPACEPRGAALPGVPPCGAALEAEARAPEGGALRILVVDDNTDAALVMADWLSAVGYTTRVAHDGPSALRLAEELVPDVAVVDIGLPVMDGYELARRLREVPALEHIHLIAVTGYGQSEDRQRSREAGFDVHLVKPVQPEQLAPLLAERRAAGPTSTTHRVQVDDASSRSNRAS